MFQGRAFLFFRSLLLATAFVPRVCPAPWGLLGQEILSQSLGGAGFVGQPQEPGRGKPGPPTTGTAKPGGVSAGQAKPAMGQDPAGPTVTKDLTEQPLTGSKDPGGDGTTTNPTGGTSRETPSGDGGEKERRADGSGPPSGQPRAPDPSFQRRFEEANREMEKPIDEFLQKWVPEQEAKEKKRREESENEEERFAKHSEVPRPQDLAGEGPAVSPSLVSRDGRLPAALNPSLVGRESPRAGGESDRERPPGMPAATGLPGERNDPGTAYRTAGKPETGVDTILAVTRKPSASSAEPGGKSARPEADAWKLGVLERILASRASESGEEGGPSAATAARGSLSPFGPRFSDRGGARPRRDFSRVLSRLLTMARGAGRPGERAAAPQGAPARLAERFKRPLRLAAMGSSWGDALSSTGESLGPLTGGELALLGLAALALTGLVVAIQLGNGIRREWGRLLYLAPMVGRRRRDAHPLPPQGRTEISSSASERHEVNPGDSTPSA